MDYNTNQERGQLCAIGSLAEAFAQIEDQRAARGVRYALTPLLVLLVLAKLAGMDTPSAIADWVKLRAEFLTAALGLKWKRMPHHSTFRRVMQRALKLPQVEAVASHFQTAHASATSDILNLDGKTLRGTIPAGETQGAHLLSVYQPETCTVLRQTAVGDKENEISAAPELLKEIDLRGKIVTGDAMLAQRKLSQQIVAAGGDYLWIVKNNQPQLRADIEYLFTAECVARTSSRDDYARAQTLDKGHGRVEQRLLTASSRLNSYLDWPDVGQVFQLRREFTHLATGKVTRETVYGVTSLTASVADAARLQTVVRAHWSIENGLHYRRDVTFKEDQTRMKSHTAAQVLAILNNLVLGLIRRAGWTNVAEGRRYFDARPRQAMQLILGSPA